MLNRNAAHPVNAMLNYGYSALQDLVCKTGGRSCFALIPYFSSAQRKAEATLFPKSKPEAGFSAASRKTSTAGPWGSLLSLHYLFGQRQFGFDLLPDERVPVKCKNTLGKL